MSHKIVSVIFLAAVLGACNKDEIGPQNITAGSFDALPGGKVYVCNEGLFGWGDASVSSYNTSSGNWSHDQFQAANSEPLGDVLQDAIRLDDRIFWSVNNSGKIVVTDLSLEKIHEIQGLTSPRYLAANEDVLMVSDLYADAVTLFNSNTYESLATVEIGEWTEHVAIVQGFGFATTPASDDYNWINLSSYNTGSLNNNPLLITGAISGQDSSVYTSYGLLSNSAIHKNKLGQSIDDIFFTPQSGLRFLNKKEDQEFFYGLVDNGLMSWDVNTSAEIINDLSDIETPYGLEYIEELDQIWIGDAKDYTSNGEVFVYSSNGELLFSQEVGRLPNGFLWVAD